MFRASRSTYCSGRTLPGQTGGELASDGRRVQVHEPSDNHDAAEERKAAGIQPAQVVFSSTTNLWRSNPNYRGHVLSYTKPTGLEMSAPYRQGLMSPAQPGCDHWGGLAD
jgi:hypothetical protein